MSILVVGGDSAEMFRQLTCGGHGYVEHWSGRKNRDMAKSIPKDTEAVIVVLDRVSHGLVRKVRTEATLSRPSRLFSKASTARWSEGSCPLGFRPMVEQDGWDRGLTLFNK